MTGGASFSEIAQACDVSTNAIVKRYARLKKEQIILGSTLIIRLDEFGYQFIVSIEIDADVSAEQQILSVARTLPGFFVGHATVGKYDLHVVILAKNFEEINEARDLLKKQKGIKRIRITSNTDKIFYFPENLIVQQGGQR